MLQFLSRSVMMRARPRWAVDPASNGCARLATALIYLNCGGVCQNVLQKNATRSENLIQPQRTVGYCQANALDQLQMMAQTIGSSRYQSYPIERGVPYRVLATFSLSSNLSVVSGARLECTIPYMSQTQACDLRQT